ncbi:MAG: helix-turn-helix domain-containing protein [Solirubrobacteraceae bacterium]|nr:helix-turn-helix domain-containing protein [Solirubrobacteraceae bacterium]
MPPTETTVVSDAGPLTAIAAAVSDGAGLPTLARAVARALDAGIVIADRGGAVLAVAARSRDEERRLLSSRGDLDATTLLVAGEATGSVVLQHRGDPDPGLVAVVLAVVALEVERVRAPTRATQEEAAAFCGDLLAGDLVDADAILERGAELGIALDAPTGALVVRVHAHVAADEGWRSRTLAAVERGARSISPSALVGLLDRGASACEVAALVPASGDGAMGRAADATFAELDGVLPGHAVAVGHGRPTDAPGDLPRALQEAMLACNVSEGDTEATVLGFEQTGAYRLLLSAMSENPEELRRFYAETIEPLAAYDGQYETDLVGTVTAYLDADGSVAAAAQRLFTHRHTVRYRLERVKELCGLDVTSSDGRERLSLGLKAMRVLGLGPQDAIAAVDRDARPRRAAGGRRGAPRP